MEFRCKLSEMVEMVARLRMAIKEPLRAYEVHPTEESLGWGRSMVCEYDYTIRVPELKIYFRDAVEFEFDEEKQDDVPKKLRIFIVKAKRSRITDLTIVF